MSKRARSEKTKGKFSSIFLALCLVIVPCVVVLEQTHLETFFEYINRHEMNNSKPLNQKEAKELATELAIDESKKVKLYDWKGDLIYINEIVFSSWVAIEKGGEKWRFSTIPPSGVYTIVEFNLDGSNPTVKIGYSSG
jgi:hypothetical protein